MDAEQLTDDEWGRIHTRKALKGFTRLDARYFVPFFTKKFTRQVSIVLLQKVKKTCAKEFAGGLVIKWTGQSTSNALFKISFSVFRH